jgi:hypothetical protein
MGILDVDICVPVVKLVVGSGKALACSMPPCAIKTPLAAVHPVSLKVEVVSQETAQ